MIYISLLLAYLYRISLSLYSTIEREHVVQMYRIVYTHQNVNFFFFAALFYLCSYKSISSIVQIQCIVSLEHFCPGFIISYTNKAMLHVGKCLNSMLNPSWAKFLGFFHKVDKHKMIAPPCRCIEQTQELAYFALCRHKGVGGFSICVIVYYRLADSIFQENNDR